MRKQIVALGLTLCTSTACFAQVALSDLVKLTPETAGKCVEYYSYQNQGYCSTKPLSDKPADMKFLKNETQNIVFDGRIWAYAWGEKSGNVTTLEYVPAGTSIDAWHELVSTQKITDVRDDATPKMFADTIINLLKKDDFKPKIVFHLVTPERLIFEYQIDAPADAAQNVMYRIAKKDGVLYVLHYDIKEADMGAEKRAVWLKNLMDSSIK